MKPDFECNEIMKQIGYTDAVTADSMEGEIVRDILQGLHVPLTNEAILIATYALTAGKILERRQNRQRKHTA